MILYRICNSDYKDDISGAGARLYGSRWNSKGLPMLYTAEHISLAALQMLVHINYGEVQVSFYLLSIFVPENASMKEIRFNKLKKLWQNDWEYTSFIGNEFVKSKETLCLKVPSALIEEEHNYLINPLHQDFKKVHITGSRQFDFDKRLFSI